MTIFLVYAHTDPAMTARLCATLKPNRVFLHVDLKTDIRKFEKELSERHCSNVRMTERRILVNWAGFSQVQAMRILIDAALKVAKPSEYLVILSGQDYPIKPVAQFTALLESQLPQQFIKCFEIAHSSNVYSSHISRRHHRDLGVLGSSKGRVRRIRSAIIRALDSVNFKSMPEKPAGMRIMHGQTHWALTAECAEEITKNITPEIERFFKYCFASDEKFFHSLVANSRFAHDADGKTTVPYAGPGNWRYTNFHHIAPSLKKIYDVRDWHEVIASSKFFVRKVESIASGELLDLIDKQLL